MKVYKSDTLNTFLLVSMFLLVLFIIVLILLFSWHILYILIFFFTPFLLLTLQPLFTSYFSIEKGYLIKEYDKKNDLGRYTSFKIKLIEIEKIERKKNVFGYNYIAIFYNDKQSIDLYLKTTEINDFITEINEAKNAPSVFY